MNRNSEDLKIYDCFHDECKEDGFWHCFIFVPREKQGELFNLLQIPRKNLNYFNSIHFSDMGRNYKSHNPKARLTESWCSILLYAIQQQKINAYLYLGHKNNRPAYELRKGNGDKIGARLIVFREKMGHQDMYDSMNSTKKIETTFRMGLKGGIHFLFFDEEIEIGNIYIDSPKKTFEENFDSRNMLDRFKMESNENIFFRENSEIIPVYKKNYKETDPISEFMQLADITVGGIRTQKLKMKDFPARYKATHPLKDLLEKETENPARMKKSRYDKGFGLNEAWIENEKWQFEKMHINVEQNNQQKFSLF
jgi:hypothetical protein